MGYVQRPRRKNDLLVGCRSPFFVGYVQQQKIRAVFVDYVVEAPSLWGMCNIEKLTFWCKENFCNKKKRRAENVSSRLVFAFIKSYYLDFSVADFVRDPVRFLTASQYPGRTMRPTGAGIIRLARQRGQGAGFGVGEPRV